jgi:hypothetical protein
VKCRLFLDIVVCKCAAFFELFAREDESLLISWYAFFILDLLLDIVYCIGGFNLKGDCLAGKGLYKDLHIVCYYVLKKYEKFKL